MRPGFLVRLLLVFVPISLLSAGCAVGPPGGPSSSGSSSATACPSPPGSTITVTELDNGSPVCAGVGQQIEFYLHGTSDRPWSPIAAEGNPLSPTSSGKLSLAVGVTGAVFIAVATGTAEVTATRPTCPSSPGGPTCNSIVMFRVLVSVHS